MTTPLTRRRFLENTTLTGAALAASSYFGLAQSAGKGRKLKIALVGCGGRGNGALENCFDACKILGVEPKLVATADAFSDKAQHTGKKFGLDSEHCFSGYDAYQKVMAGDCELVLLATPPNFRPVHLAAAVDAGKNVFMEKPVAVDPPGVRKIIESGDKAKTKGLGIVAGTQRRHQKGYLVNKAKIDAGAIGEIKGGVVQWNGRVPWTKPRQPGWSDIEYITRNWLNFFEMSGDHIVEQHVHNIDVALWFLGRPPVSALGFGGRARRKTGDQFDFFSVDLDFGEGVHIHSQCRQLAGAYSKVGEMFTGADGICLGGGKIRGKDVSIPEINVDSGNPYVQEHVDLIRSIHAGEPLNEARQVAESTLVAIMGRLSAYTGRLVRWSDVTKNKESPFYGYTCQPMAADFEAGTITLPPETPPVPGRA